MKPLYFIQYNGPPCSDFHALINLDVGPKKLWRNPYRPASDQIIHQIKETMSAINIMHRVGSLIVCTHHVQYWSKDLAESVSKNELSLYVYGSGS